MSDAPPDRSAFVRYAVEKYAAVTTWVDYWRLVDSLRDRRADLRREGNRAADREVGTAAAAAFNRMPIIPDSRKSP